MSMNKDVKHLIVHHELNYHCLLCYYICIYLLLFFCLLVTKWKCNFKNELPWQWELYMC